MLLQKSFVALILAIAILLGLGGAATWANPNQFAIEVDANGNAVAGYDTVAYVTDGRALKGRAEIVHVWKGAKWLFASVAHRDLFVADPERYAPRIGGFCATGAAGGRMVAVDPEAWLVVDGRLYLYANAGVRDLAAEDLAASTAAAEKGWQELKGNQ